MEIIVHKDAKKKILQVRERYVEHTTAHNSSFTALLFQKQLSHLREIIKVMGEKKYKY